MPCALAAAIETNSTTAAKNPLIKCPIRCFADPPEVVYMFLSVCNNGLAPEPKATVPDVSRSVYFALPELPARLMAGRQVLALLIEVRILGGQPTDF